MIKVNKFIWERLQNQLSLTEIKLFCIYSTFIKGKVMRLELN